MTSIINFQIINMRKWKQLRFRLFRPRLDSVQHGRQSGHASGHSADHAAVRPSSLGTAAIAPIVANQEDKIGSMSAVEAF